MDVHADMRRSAALRAVQKPPTKPWRGATGASAASPPPPPKVYRVEPREFRDLVQRLTGAPPTATAGRGAMRQQQQVAVAAVQPQQPVAVRAGGEEQQQVYAPWFAFPMAGLDGHHHANGALM